MKNKEKNKNIIWKDKIRHMGLPLSFTKYYIEGERLYIESGFFTTKTNEILLYRILDIKTKRTLWQKIFGVGTVVLYSADQSDKVLELKNIKKSKSVHKLISSMVEEIKKERGIIGREMMGTTPFADMDSDGVPDVLE